MDLFGKFNIPFMGQRYIAFIFSSVLVISSIFFLSTKGLKYGIDFAGGLEIHYQFSSEQVKISEIREALAALALQDSMETYRCE